MIIKTVYLRLMPSQTAARSLFWMKPRQVSKSSSYGIENQLTIGLERSCCQSLRAWKSVACPTMKGRVDVKGAEVSDMLAEIKMEQYTVPFIIGDPTSRGD